MGFGSYWPAKPTNCNKKLYILTKIYFEKIKNL